MVIGQIKNGIVLDHITAGKGMDIYKALGLGNIDCTVAMINNAESTKMGRKDIIKVGKIIDLDLTVLGYIDPGITVNIIREGKLYKRDKLSLPTRLTNVLFCKNPRCISGGEQELDHIFTLVDADTRTYRCVYCETRAK